MSVGNRAADILADGESKFLFVGNETGCCPSGPPTITSFAIGTSGTLTQASNINLPNPNSDFMGMAFDPSNTNLYASSDVVNTGGSISALSVDRSSGHLSSIAPDAGGPQPGRLAVHPNGVLLYAARIPRHHTADFGGIELYSRDPANGKITDQQKQFPAFFIGVYSEVGITPDGKFLIAAETDTTPTGELTVFSIDTGTGSLTITSRVMDRAFNGMAIDHSGHFVVASDESGAVHSYAINPGGTLTLVSSVTAGANVSSVVFDPGNKYVYVQNGNGAQIFGFSFDAASGKLATINGSPFTTGAVPTRMATAAPKQ